jgi:hypothetical protein
MPPTPPGRKWEESMSLAFKVLPSLVLVEWRKRGEVLRAGGLSGLSGVLGVAQAWKLCQNPLWFNRVFQALVQSSVGALPEFYEFQ